MMSDMENDNEISFSVKFLGRIEVVRPSGMEVLVEAVTSLQKQGKETGDKAKIKNKVHLFISRTSIDILEHKTKFMLYSCSFSSVSFCAVHQLKPKLFGFIAKNPAMDSYHCYILQSATFSHLLVSLMGEALEASQRSNNVRENRDLVVEALRHKNKVLQRENAELRRKLRNKGGSDGSEDDSDLSNTDRSTGQVRFSSGADAPLLKNF